MPLQDDNQGQNSSPDPKLDEQTAAKPADTVDAKPSTATQDDPKGELLSVVRDVVSKSRKQETSEANSSTAGEEDQEDKPTKKADAEDYSDVPFNKHPRFQQILREKNALKEDAGRYHNVQTFIRDRGLNDQEAAEGLEIMGLAKSNPAEAWQRIKPWVQKVLIAAGEVLPDDLHKRVSAGEMNQQAALELSRARATSESLNTQQAFQEQLRKERETREQQTSLASTAQAWESDRRLKDPNFDAKYEDIQKEVHWLIQKEGRPTTADGVKEQLRKAYKAVNDRIAPVVQTPQVQRPAVRPITGGQVAGNQLPANASTLDIVRANRRVG